MRFPVSIRAFVLIASVVSVPSMGFAQPVWEYLQLPVPLGGSGALFADTIDDALYVGGNYSLDGNSQLGDNALFRYRNGQWDTLPGLNYPVSSIIRYGDSLLVTGGIYTVTGDTTYPIMRWDGVTWQPFGYFPSGGVNRMRILNGELYAVGTFPTADGHACNGVAKRQGGCWVNVGLPEFAYDEISVYDIALYQGQLAIAGNCNAVGSTSRDIMAYDGQNWYKLCEPGILGSFAGGHALIEYHGDLYVTGLMLKSAGNVGHSIQRWDGSQWHDLDVGLTYQPGNFGFVSGGWQLLVRDGLLWVGGGFYYAGTTPAWSIATWDGHRWCGLGGELNPISYDFTFFHDTLYATCQLPSSGGHVHDVARYIGASYADTCGLGVDIAEQAGQPFALSATETSEGLWVHGLPDGPHQFTLHDALGRVVTQQQAGSAGEGVLLPGTGNLSTGMYILRADGREVVKVWVGAR